MASSREKVKWQMKKAIECLDSCLEHLQIIDEMSNGQSPVIEGTMPQVVVMVDGTRNVLIEFDKKL